MRLGAYPAHLEPGSLVAALYGATDVTERHRHRFEVSNAYRDRLAEAGLRWSGTSPDGALVEFLELPGHPFFAATQAHPELRSRPTRPHPLFVGLVGAAVRHRREALGQLPVDLPAAARGADGVGIAAAP
jgi:CTP synthase